jgi:nitrogenase subunit NifH
MPDKVHIVLSGYYDGSSRIDAETVVAVFPTLQKAQRFVDLAKTLTPSKELVVVTKDIEP